jgi:hypothetical protein
MVKKMKDKVAKDVLNGAISPQDANAFKDSGKVYTDDEIINMCKKWIESRK